MHSLSTNACTTRAQFTEVDSVRRESYKCGTITIRNAHQVFNDLFDPGLGTFNAVFCSFQSDTVRITSLLGETDDYSTVFIADLTNYLLIEMMCYFGNFQLPLLLFTFCAVCVCVCVCVCVFSSLIS